MTTNISLMHESVFVIIQDDVYIYIYNIISHYMRRYIITTNIIVIHENVYRVIRDDV